MSSVPKKRSILPFQRGVRRRQTDKWLVVRAYLPVESISVVLGGRDDHIDKEIKEEVAQLQAA
jgi:hypothetical protein